MNDIASNQLCEACGAVKVKRKISGWRCRDCDNKYQRSFYAKNPDLIRKRKRESMAKSRLDPEKREKLNESGRKSYKKIGSRRQKDRVARMRQNRPFLWRSQLLRGHTGNKSITESFLISLWESQCGICALTGEKMDIYESDIDHKIPLSRGGTHELSNLRWVTRRANNAKRDLLDEEFILLCKNVISTIG